ncbi:uncharacterized protein LY79DRAFT_562503 [Colletotrichum navitas]|uniref:Uncharacterized protein n=1 Tax=Colletotrichum navitas TaxID=681940 RepID=A0AAD8PT27_9PEZI|nr:uncharacterized protein LY79DRAFT_562503 [Colletotrichum navitas]KAK1580165.1 hypothetical protein LY79DRAFT_562503 [Colletotrichum navitas]
MTSRTGKSRRHKCATFTGALMRLLPPLGQRTAPRVSFGRVPPVKTYPHSAATGRRAAVCGGSPSTGHGSARECTR